MKEENSLTMSIGGICILIECDNNDFLSQIRDIYSNFIVNDTDPVILIEMEALNDKEMPNLNLDFLKVVSNNEDLYRIFWNSFSGEFNLHNLEGKLKYTAHRDLNNYLRAVYSLVLLKDNGFLVHAASLIKEGAGFLFPGKSGTGKTTITRLSINSIPLSDEISLVKMVNGRYNVFGTPFWNELTIAGDNTHIPLKQVYLPKQDKKNYKKAASPAKILQNLIPNVIFFLDDDELKMQLFNICYDFANTVPAYELHFLPDPSFWSVINEK